MGIQGRAHDWSGQRVLAADDDEDRDGEIPAAAREYLRS